MFTFVAAGSALSVVYLSSLSAVKFSKRYSNSFHSQSPLIFKPINLQNLGYDFYQNNIIYFSFKLKFISVLSCVSYYSYLKPPWLYWISVMNKNNYYANGKCDKNSKCIHFCWQKLKNFNKLLTFDGDLKIYILM